MAERQFGPYRLVRQIAVGGMAEIHLAKTKGIAGFEKYVALKMIHPNFAEDDQFIQMLVDEAKIAVHLTHANIAQTFDLGRVGDTYYITMEYVDGSDLYKILRRASEIDYEMPLDVCAFVGKEMLQALDHAHRKRDHTGKPMGIVHRDVSPQNVLISHAGEVKLVDFGIAKATSKAKQTAVGVIKGKYYYMSPEQAWGDPIDHRSDIFSAGIVIYEMMTGQMLYLEEDLHRLLDMVRKADIAPPSRLRKGIPPQLERIIMHALQKVPGERYQTAGDFASDLERFLHSYAPAFSSSKVANAVRTVLGDPVQVEAPDIEVRDGSLSTMELDANLLAKASDEIERDENSMIFSVEDLKANDEAEKKKKAAAAPRPEVKRAEQKPLPKIAPAQQTGPQPQVKPAPKPAVAAKPAARPRQADEETREIAPAGLDLGAASRRDPEGDSVVLRSKMAAWDASSTQPGADDELENIGERTMITSPSFYQPSDDLEGGDATMITSAPPSAPDDEDDPDTVTGQHDAADDDGPTIQRDFSQAKPMPKKKSAPVPPALAAKVPTPAVSAVRTPRPSRRTPPNGVPAQSNVLQAIVQSAPSEAMPTPRPQKKTQPPPMPTPPSTPYQTGPQPLAQQPAQPPMQPPAQAQYGYPPQPTYPQPYPPPYQSYPPQQVSPQALYPVSLYGSGAQQPQPATLTGQLRLSEGDAIPEAYKIGSNKRRWIGLVVGASVAVVLAASVTYFIVRASRDSGSTVASILVESQPPGALVTFDDVAQATRTPMSIDHVPVGTHHTVKVELPRYAPYTTDVDVRAGSKPSVVAALEKLKGKLLIDTTPPGAQILINGEVRGITPKTLNDIDMDAAKTVELRLKDYKPVTRELAWPANGQLSLPITLELAR